MKPKILYVYGYNSSPVSSTMKALQKALPEYDFVSVKYDQMHPYLGIGTIEDYMSENEIRLVIGHSLGGFVVMLLENLCKKIAINPCMKPRVELPQLGDVPVSTIYDYQHLEEYVVNSPDWAKGSILGLFGRNDELFSYFDMFKEHYGSTYWVDAGHRLEEGKVDEKIVEKIRNYFK